jgi:hypothetical protein
MTRPLLVGRGPVQSRSRGSRVLSRPPPSRKRRATLHEWSGLLRRAELSGNFRPERFSVLAAGLARRPCVRNLQLQLFDHDCRRLPLRQRARRLEQSRSVRRVAPSRGLGLAPVHICTGTQHDPCAVPPVLVHPWRRPLTRALCHSRTGAAARFAIPTSSCVDRLGAGYWSTQGRRCFSEQRFSDLSFYVLLQLCIMQVGQCR